MKHPEGVKKQDVDAETLVARLMEALELTKSFIQNAKQQNTLPEQARVEYEKAATISVSQTRKRHPVAGLCDDYLDQTAAWLKQEKNLLEQAGHQQAYEVNLSLRSEPEAILILNTLKDAWEVIKWYRTLIPVKVISALQLLERPRTPELSAYFVGKAKLVLVSIDSSLAAWHTLLNHYPEKTDELLDMLLLLDRIRRHMEETFPTARDFRRPGLD